MFPWIWILTTKFPDVIARWKLDRQTKTVYQNQNKETGKGKKHRKKTIKFGYKPGQQGPRETNSTKSKKTQTWKLKIFILLLHQNQNKKKHGKCKNTEKMINSGYKPGGFREAPTLCATINQYLITKNNDNEIITIYYFIDYDI